MELLNNLDIILSVVCSIGSIVMFLLAKKETDKCKQISTEIKNYIKIADDSSKEINSKDEFNINNVHNFDNRKSIR